MARKRLTELLPFLYPLRKKQRKLFFYLKMRWDKNRYAGCQSLALLPFKIAESSSPLYNPDTGMAMIYQENKVHNLQLAAAKLDRLLIQPGETFSFWRAVRGADRLTPYKEGLAMQNGQLIACYGGGMCQMSNLLFQLFLASPLTIVERHGHRSKDFPELADVPLRGVDATVAEGWLDLKVRNDTETTFEIRLSFNEERIFGGLYAERPAEYCYRLENRELHYWQNGGATYEQVAVWRLAYWRSGGELAQEELLYRNQCRIGYPPTVEMLHELANNTNNKEEQLCTV